MIGDLLDQTQAIAKKIPIPQRNGMSINQPFRNYDNI